MIKIYHNPRCSKSRQALEILENSGEKFEIIEYLKNPPTVEELENFLSILGEELIRKKEDEYTPYKDKKMSHLDWAKILHKTPKLMERPLVINGKKVVIARPPEKIKEVL